MEFEIGGRIYDGKRPLLMGILNVTPDSFSDGGKYYDRERAVTHGLELAGEGADILDIGGESTRPGSEPVSEDEELARVIPVVEELARRISIPISVDTTRAEVARQALSVGAAMINDISALNHDPRMAEVVASSGCSTALQHMAGNPRTMQDAPRYVDVVAEVLEYLRERVSFAAGMGIPRRKILVDPGIGFGKTLEHNLDLIRNVSRFHETGCPVLIGASRKGMIGKITGAPVEDRDWGTAAITSWCVWRGVEVQRVHAVKAMRQVCDVAVAIR